MRIYNLRAPTLLQTCQRGKSWIPPTKPNKTEKGPAREREESYLTNFVTEPAQQVVGDVVLWVEDGGPVYVLLKLKTVQDLLLHSLELSPATQGDGVPLVGLGDVLIDVESSLSTLHSLSDEIFLYVSSSVLTRQHCVEVLSLAKPPEEGRVVVVLRQAVGDHFEGQLLLLLTSLH